MEPQHIPDPTLEDAVSIEVKDLNLDPKNPRLAESGFEIEDQVEILRVLWRDRAVNEIADSIAISGFWKHEVLFATEESGKLVVVEGNRRLAAVKLLVDDSLRAKIGASGLPPIGSAPLTDERLEELRTLPVIKCTRQQVWEFIGFKHVNGPQPWDSLSKAQYIARVHNEYQVPLREIARTIGDRHNTVRRLYRGLMVLEQAERTGRFHRKDRYKTRFAYSHLWTGLGYSGIQDFLGLGPDDGYKPDPVPDNKVENLIKLCDWLYGSKRRNIAPVIHSQNPDLRNLDQVLQSKDGVAALRSGLDLQIALNISRGDKLLLREALVLSEQSLRQAVSYVGTGYEGEEDLLNRAKAIHILASEIRNSMQEMYEAQEAND